MLVQTAARLVPAFMLCHPTLSIANKHETPLKTLLHRLIYYIFWLVAFGVQNAASKNLFDHPILTSAPILTFVTISGTP